MNWNKVLLEAVTFGLDEIPVVGSLLEHIAYALWPESQEDIWEEIKDKVEKLVNKKISDEVYNRVATNLGSRVEQDGLIGVIQSYLHAIDLKSSPSEIQSRFDAADLIFIKTESSFQEKGYELLLLPLFAQFANMHLSLLRDGVTRGWYRADDLQNRIDLYSNYVDKQYKIGAAERMKNSKGSYNYINTFRRQMTLDVLNFRDTWKYYNPATYAPPVKLSFPRDIYFTLTEQYPPAYNNKTVYGAPGKMDRKLEEIELIWLEDSYDGYNFVQGFVSNYASGNTDYEGVLWSNKMPNYNKKCNPDYEYNCFHKKDIKIQADNPIVAIQAEYEAGGAVYSLSFGFKDGKWTGYIPNPNVESYPHHFVVRPPEGYFLTSIWAPQKQGYYYGALDVLFGFSLDPKLLKPIVHSEK